MKFYAKLTILAAIAILFFSCRTDRNTVLQDKPLNSYEKAPLFGMIYDDRNQPCQNVILTVTAYERLGSDDSSMNPSEIRLVGRTAISDVNGRFFFPDFRQGTYTITTEKPGYETQLLTFTFTNQSQVAYFRLASYQGLLMAAEEALSEGKWTRAEQLWARAAIVEPEDTGWLFFGAVLFYKTGDMEKALSYLDMLKVRGVNNDAVNGFEALMEEMTINE